jgi:hypothetical protein
VASVQPPSAAARVASAELTRTEPVTAEFAVRRDPDAAIVAVGGESLHLFDLSGLPALRETEVLDAPALGGVVPAGGIDCSDLCCYADTTGGEILVLCR